MVGLIGLPVVALAVTTVAVPAAATQDRPTGVAHVRVDKRVWLQADGTVTVAARVRCDPGWESGELDVRVTQGDSEADGFINTSVPCNRRWHRVQFGLPLGLGTLQRGKAALSGQFLVTNVASGDSAGAHDQANGFIHRARVSK